MNSFFKTLLERETANGRLALLTNLLYETVFVGWIAFAGLYALEVLLPTFVAARLSLVKFALVLFVLSSLLVWLGQHLKREISSSKKENGRFFLLFVAIIVLGIVTLAHYRFPWWSIPISVGSYGLIVWLFFRRSETES